MVVAYIAEHWLRYNFAPVGHPWYEGAAWPNVAAVLPLALLGAAGFIYHHVVLRRMHRELEARHDEHSLKLAAMLDVLDPDSDGGLQVVLDRLDDQTPGGLSATNDRIEALRGDLVVSRGMAEPERRPHETG